MTRYAEDLTVSEVIELDDRGRGLVTTTSELRGGGWA
ncbi:hypothetical protein SAMN05444580_11230 [Rhodococcus tukisamuensis]|uniref:Uncharacterized protein n=1 Tax=Rhodococcus tukisamuensis TaxID=168276 RepID=A0A1G7B1U1_9NOCA|nr:hypothetical protein SAMN05444580_11230 [Rhodococcus tukisamuensis]